MPWKECHVMDERLRFVARLLEGEKMAPLCPSSTVGTRGEQKANMIGWTRCGRFRTCTVSFTRPSLGDAEEATAGLSECAASKRRRRNSSGRGKWC
jgi:hypothetical protein